jgi:hypothetical protein
MAKAKIGRWGSMIGAGKVHLLAESIMADLWSSVRTIGLKSMPQ